MPKHKVIWDVVHDLFRVQHPYTGKQVWLSWEAFHSWRNHMRFSVHPDEVQLIPEYPRREIEYYSTELRRLVGRKTIEPLGTDMPRTIEETPKSNIQRTLRKWGSSAIKADSRNKRAQNYNYFRQTTLLKHPKMGAWFNDPTVPNIIKEDVKRFYNVLLGSLQGKRSEYVLSVLITIAADCNRLDYDPQYGFVDKYNHETWDKYYNELIVKLSEKLTTFKRPDGSRASLTLIRKR